MKQERLKKKLSKLIKYMYGQSLKLDNNFLAFLKMGQEIIKYTKHVVSSGLL